MWWNPFYIVLILLSTVVDYFCAIEIEKKKDRRDKRTILLLSYMTNFGLLFIFKYYNFFADAAESLLGFFISGFSLPVSKLLLPVGISFYTFQTLSYTLDVYRGKKKAEKHFGYFALFVTFFPQLVAGPIERASVLLPQLKEEHKFDYYRITSGFRRMALGYFKKCVIADRLAITVDLVYANPTNFNSFQLIVATLLFSYQIYCDFSGYSDIAIGASRVLGITIQENFDRPFHSKSLTELWQRWHMSIMKWFKDYIYMPLLFRNKKNLKPEMILRRTIEAILCVFVFSGLWHGSALHYVVFGLMTGIIVIFEMLISKKTKIIQAKLKDSWFDKIIQCFKVTYVYIIFSFCVVMFRADSVSMALNIWMKIISEFSVSPYTATSVSAMLFEVISNENLIVFILSFLMLEVLQIMQYKYDIYEDIIKKSNVVVRFMVYYIILGFIIYFSIYSESQFIYFQF